MSTKKRGIFAAILLLVSVVCFAGFATRGGENASEPENEVCIEGQDVISSGTIV